MRYTLEQLKAMSDAELYQLWGSAIFPFDAATCTHCLTTHADLRRDLLACKEPSHQELIRNVAALAEPCRDSPRLDHLSERLEELYALRLFYDHLYPQPAEPAQAEKLEQVVIAEEAAEITPEQWDKLIESDRDWSANTR